MYDDERISWQLSSPYMSSRMSEPPLMDFNEAVSFNGSADDIYKLNDHFNLAKKKTQALFTFSEKI